MRPGAGRTSDEPSHYFEPASRSSSPIQAKLAVNAPGDRYEREADRVADRMMRMEAPSSGGAAASIQRKCAGCEEEEQRMQRSGVGEPDGSRDAEEKVAAIQGGRALTSAERYFFEPRFGSDFGGVRIHTGSRADAAARSVGALAYTRGRDIVFREGVYTGPDKPGSRRLLAHELTHVVQQGAAGSMSSSAPAAGRGLQRQEETSRSDTTVPAAHPMATERRSSSECSPVYDLPVSESFAPYVRGVTYSRAFHAPAGRTINVDVSAEYDTSTSPAATFGVDVYQCCVVSDSRVTSTQAIGTIGNPGHPAHIRSAVTLSDECSWSSRHNGEFIYYLRIYNANQSGDVRIAYTVS